MGDVIRKNAAAEDIFADLATSDVNARAHTGPIDLKPLCDRYLKQHLSLAKLIADKRDKAREEYRPLKAKLDAQDDAADALLLRISDDIWNDTGRSMEDPAYDVLFPGGIGYYTEGRDEEQPARMHLLATLLESGVHPRLGEPEAKDYAAEIRAAAASYAAACAALGALAQVRRAAGLPALCVDWCASRTLPPAVVTGALTRLLAEAATRVAVVPGTGPARWATTGAANLPLLAELTPRGDEPGPGPAAAAPPDLAARLLAAPAGARRSLLADHVQREVERVLGFPPGQRVSPTQGLFDLGADSLMALELKNRLQRALGRPLVPTLVFDHPTIDALSDHLAGLFTDPTPPAPTSDTQARLIDEVAGLSEDELAAMIDRELAGLLP